MSHSPPIPEASQSPYPRQEPKHDRPDESPQPRVAETPATAPALPIGTIGAVIGLGAVAIGGAILGLRLWGSRTAPKRKGRRKARK